MRSLTSPHTKRISGPRKFRSSPKKDFCNNIGPQSGRRQAAPDPITGRMKHTTCPKLLQSHNRPALVRRLTYVDMMTITCWDILQRGIYHLMLMPSLGSRSGRCNSRCGPVRRVPVLNPAPVRYSENPPARSRRELRPMRCRDGSEFCGRTSSAVSDKPDNHLARRFLPLSGRWVA